MEIKYKPDNFTPLSSKKDYIKFLHLLFKYPFEPIDKIQAVKLMRKLWSGLSSPRAARLVDTFQENLYDLEKEIKRLETEYPEYIL